MEVILLQDIGKLGKQGDVVKVKDGYARNYLMPRKLAAESNPQAVKMIAALKKKRQEAEEKLKSQAGELAKKISALSLTIGAEAGVEDTLFGSITSEMVRNSLRNENLEIDKKDIIIEEPIKKLGVYQVQIKLHPEVSASLRIWVVKK